MRIGVVTSLYPGPPKPHEGIFAERRWLGMRARGHTVRVVSPQPRAGGSLGRALGRVVGRVVGRDWGRDWGAIAAMPRFEERGGIPVERPRYLHLPGRPRANARRFARAALTQLRAGESQLRAREARLRAREARLRSGGGSDGAGGDAAPSPEVIVCDYAWPAAALAPLLAHGGPPCVVNGRGSDVLEVAGEAGLGTELAACLRAAGHWCAVSAELVERMDDLGGDAGRGCLVPNGVDTDLFHPGDRGSARARLDLDGEGTLILVVGHLIPRKDPLLALAAFEAFLAAGGGPARLAFVGRGPLEGDLRSAVRAARLEERVRLVGEREPGELAHWYAAADALLLTSRREGRPNVVLEALASGRPVLACASGGTAEVIRDERMLARGREAGLLGRRLAALLADPPAPAQLAASVAHLSWNASLEALERCLEQAVEERGAR